MLIRQTVDAFGRQGERTHLCAHTTKRRNDITQSQRGHAERMIRLLGVAQSRSSLGKAPWSTPYFDGDVTIVATIVALTDEPYPMFRHRYPVTNMESHRSPTP